MTKTLVEQSHDIEKRDELTSTVMAIIAGASDLLQYLPIKNSDGRYVTFNREEDPIFNKEGDVIYDTNFNNFDLEFTEEGSLKDRFCEPLTNAGGSK